MSFVSVIATKEYLSVMTDGQAQQYDGEIVQKDYIKYRMISDKLIVAATGDVEIIDKFYEESFAMYEFGLNIKQMALKLQELMIEFVEYNEEDPLLGYCINMLVGGVAEDGELEYYILSNSYQSMEELVMYDFRDEDAGDFAASYLVSPYAPSSKELSDTLYSAVKKNGDTFLVNYGENIISAQKELHKYVASVDSTVNDITFSKVINKRAYL
ncbi:hypothetical protein [Bacillus sp. Brlt_9]|uniref:hypothetical protein n=1 Tax=Bacillus sp. Brlt_9 TaxID=3110916 RepID=UPI003F7C5CC9